MDLGTIKKETPLTEKKGRKTIYLLADNFFRFWYRFVPQNIAAINSGRIERTYQAAVRSQLPDYMGLVFEQMCRDYLLYYAQVFGKGSSYHFYIFSKGGFTQGLQEMAEKGEVTLVTLQELYQ